MPWQAGRGGQNRATIVLPDAQDPRDAARLARPIRSEARARLVAGIAQARAWLDELVSGAVTSTQALAEREGLSERAVRLRLNLASLAPDLVRAAIAGTLPRHAGLTSLAEVPLGWTEQRILLG